MKDTVQRQGTARRVTARRPGRGNTDGQLARAATHAALADLHANVETSPAVRRLTGLQRRADAARGAGAAIRTNGAPIQRQLSENDAATLGANVFSGRKPTEEEMQVFTPFFDDLEGVKWVKTEFELANYAQIARICSTRFGLADLRRLVGAYPDTLFSAEHLEHLAGLTGNPSMADIVQLLGTKLGEVEVALGHLAKLAALNFSLAQIYQLSQLANVKSWGEVKQLSDATVPFADIQVFNALTAGGNACSAAQMITCHQMRFTASQLQQLCPLPQIGQWNDLSRLNATTTTPANIIAYSACTVGGNRISMDRLVACENDRFSPADMTKVLALPQVTSWPDFERLNARADWNAERLEALSGAQLGGHAPTLDQMVAATTFSPSELGNLGRMGSWTNIGHLATIHSAPTDQDPDESVVHSMTALGVNEKKQDVGGVLDETRSCWNWATQGFEDPEVPDDTLFTYFSRRTNFPPYYGGTLNHAAAVTYLAGNNDPNNPIRVYLNRIQGTLQNIIQTWQANHLLHAQQANQAAQLALMRLHLTESGFTVLAQGTNARWYICMHELKSNVGWEHWWIKSRLGDVIETFPVNPDQRGKYIAFHQSDVNMGDTNTDFRHEVPVQNLLPAQRTIIRRAMNRYKQKIVNTIN